MPASIIEIKERLWQLAERRCANAPLRVDEHAKPVLGDDGMGGYML